MDEYKVTIGGLEHTLLLSPEEAKTRGLDDPKTKEASAPKNKARTAAEKD